MTTDKDRADFEAAYANAFPYSAGTPGKFDLCEEGSYKDVRVMIGFAMWQAATAEERERAAKVCENRAGPQGTGAFQILMSAADAIRSGE